ncbi:3-dehydroquinate synthase [Corynebacterium uberis]|uniref:3-dehydroquinate synthase n=1 Tax=Corynebacterium TaxID=1716 RepID=UPI001D0A8AE4|nr:MULTISPECIES: 3-dehydroquinate synthase [Corynebacterium]MCZ9308569.1 3-dehydroquinate synthase [Corynebacterium sp. c6VSa_13]UDL74219.1 3-dehydroquinate synthase [Corynebacterium uberis]UDL74901.1 3-dehydroquinate synthase [Corynebacterium uberis]UDL77115.1 3-dehydroquinate synthase [Corynebacterium uberis]UDL79398.1 3-dehydroquinate synthase [Corynebacterium uberis]
MSNRTIPVATAAAYEVTIGHGLNAEVAAHVATAGSTRAAIIHQPTVAAQAEALVAALRDAGVEALSVAVPDAEAGKTLESIGRVWDACGEYRIDRADTIIGLGGGAATDLAGFAAATWMRGVRLVQVPTSLLGMVDAAVGGKTGINTAAGKNLVGCFHEPSGVFVDLEHLASLPHEELVSGMGEIVKCGFIADPRIVELVEADPAAVWDLNGVLPELVERAISVKAQVVAADLRESARREILNYGHTFGHAIEQVEHYSWRHGHAVAVGMVFAAELACARGLIDRELVERHRTVLSAVGLPISYSGGDRQALWEAMRRDKKVRHGVVRFVVLDGTLGQVTRLEGPTEAELEAAATAVGGEHK